MKAIIAATAFSLALTTPGLAQFEPPAHLVEQAKEWARRNASVVQSEQAKKRATFKRFNVDEEEVALAFSRKHCLRVGPWVLIPIVPAPEASSLVLGTGTTMWTIA